MKNVNEILASTNLVDDLSEDEQRNIVQDVLDGFEIDAQSRDKWEKSVDKWTTMALQVAGTKTYPWPKASNVRYPLLSTAAMQFSARAYPSLVPSNGKIVQIQVIGKDPDGQKQARAERVATYMSWQVMSEMDDWEEEMDKLLMILPIIGVCFKKTYYSKGKGRNCSELVLPKSLVVNYWAKDLDCVERKTEVIEMSDRVLMERMREGVFKEYKDLPKADMQTIREYIRGTQDNSKQTDEPSTTDKTTPQIVLEQHGFRDLDGDGYPEPYVFTVHPASRKLLRVVARFTEDDIKYNDKGEISCIYPTEYYTKYGFIPNPDGGFYDVGFGLLLGTINNSINTNINLLTDAGVLSNMQSGFLSKSLRMTQGGEIKFKPGEWKWVNATGDQLKNGIVPLPIREPSPTLLKLLELMIQSGKELASVAEIFVGKMPGQNTPATTTMATIEQGMKLFTAIYKRIYRALGEEFEKLYTLNGIYSDEKIEAAVLDEPINRQDFNTKDYDIAPAADPTAFSSTQKLIKAQALTELLPLGTIDPMEVTKRILEAQDQPNIQQLMRQGPPPPDPKMVEMQQKQKLQEAKAQSDMAVKKFSAEVDARGKQFKQMMDASQKRMEMQHTQQMAALDARIQLLNTQLQMAAGAQKMHQSDQQFKQKMQQNREQHAQKMRQQPKNHQNKS